VRIFALENLIKNASCFKNPAVSLDFASMSLGFPEMVFIVVLALLLFGPRRLPEIARTWGKFMAEFKKASNEFQGQIHEEIRKLELEEADPRKHLEPEIAKLSSDEDLSIQGALNRLTERMKNSVPQDYDA
jgi:sec-independent protein translocase protein TatA